MSGTGVRWTAPLSKTSAILTPTKEVLGAYGTVISSVSTVCALGTGLTYATIFSWVFDGPSQCLCGLIPLTLRAIRGDVTYMQWAFSFFITGLVIVTFIQGILQWGTTLPQYSTLSIGLWEAIVAFGVFSSIAMVVSAFCLLLVSVYRFRPVDGDAIQTSGSSKTPVIIAFTVRIHTFVHCPFNLRSNITYSGGRCKCWHNTNHLRIVCCGTRHQCFIVGEVSGSCQVTEETSGWLFVSSVMACEDRSFLIHFTILHDSSKWLSSFLSWFESTNSEAVTSKWFL